MMQLFGSLTSPYVRRIRAFAIENNIDFEFINLNIFAEKDRATLIKLNPTRKIPMLVDDKQVVLDSSVICRYLCQKFNLSGLTWQQENQLTMINSVNDSLVELLICQRSGFDTEQDKLFFNLQHERVQGVLSVLEQAAKEQEFSVYNYVSISLFCLIDWILFRGMTDLSPFPALTQFHEINAQRQSNLNTAPKD